jgi:hypothetical protein
MKDMSETRDYLVKLENNLMDGSGRWIADFQESFWDYRIGGNSFDMVILGNTRPKGFLISRFFAWLTLPAYRVACFAYSNDTELRRLGKLTKSIRGYMEEQEMTWAWLVLTGEGSFTRKAKAGIQKDNSKEIGIALVDIAAQEVITNDSVLGRRMRQFVRAFK